MWPWVRIGGAAIAAVIGVVVERALAPPIALALAVLALMLIARPVPRRVRIVVAVGAIAAVLAARERVTAPPLPLGVDDRDEDVVEGWIAGAPVALPDATAFVVDSDLGPVWVTVDGAPAAWPGDRVQVRGRLRSPRGYRNPGSPDRAAIARSRGAAWELSAREVRVVRADDRASLWRWPAQLARATSRTIAARGGDRVGNALVRAVVVGDRSAVDAATDDAWRAAGVYHALSVSGLHLAVVALAVFAALRRALALVPPIATRVAPRRAAAAIALPIAVLYTLVTGGQVATVRALVAVAVVLIGEIIERRARVSDALGLAALLAIAHRPSVVWDPAFELSFVAALVLIASARDATAVDGGRARRIAVALGRAVRTSWRVTLATAPITAWHFGQVSLGGVIGNLIAGPAFELAALPLGLLGATLSAISPTLGGLCIDAAVAIAGLAAQLIAQLARITPTLHVRAPSTIELVLCGALLALWLVRAEESRRRRAVRVALAIALAIAWWWHRPQRDDALRVTFLDVGQGDAAVIELPDGAVWLIDAGGAPGGGSVQAQLGPGRAVAAFLRHRGVRAIDLAIISHPHPDHYLGLLAVAAEVPIRTLWAAAPADDEHDDDPAAASRGGLGYRAVVGALAAAGTRVETPTLGASTHGDVTLEVLAPGEHGLATADPVRTVNDNSLVVRVARGGTRVLFLGDLEDEGEEALVARGDLAATIVKVAHHGSPTSSTAALVEATRPRWAVMSLGRGNRFRFPAPAVVARWRAVGAAVVRTDEVGATTARIHADGTIEVTSFDPPPFDPPAGETAPPPRVIMPR